MGKNTGNIIQFLATNSANEEIHKYALSYMPYSELKTVVEDELEQLIKNVLPHDWLPQLAPLNPDALSRMLLTVYHSTS